MKTKLFLLIAILVLGINAMSQEVTKEIYVHENTSGYDKLEHNTKKLDSGWYGVVSEDYSSITISDGKTEYRVQKTWRKSRTILTKKKQNDYKNKRAHPSTKKFYR